MKALIFGAALFASGIAILVRADTTNLATAASLGKASYSLYALHAPLLSLLLLIGIPWWFAGPVVIATALLVNRIYENPLIQMGKRLAKPAAGECP